MVDVRMGLCLCLCMVPDYRLFLTERYLPLHPADNN
jgi:hypothetical protein